MANIAYVDHSYHKKTVSTKFLPEILESKGHKVDFFWDNAWKGGAAVSFSEVKNYDTVIMFQSYCKLDSECFFSQVHNNVVYIPMLDQFGLWRGPLSNTSYFWETFQGCKVINFSIASHGLTVGVGIRSKLVRFYREPKKISKVNGLHGFLWVRLEDEVSWSRVKTLIGSTKFDSFHVHIAKDPGSREVRLPSKQDIELYNISLSTWFENKGDLEDILDNCNVYFTPRMEEGIGQSFLEAFARGQCIVAPNNGTMNEYISDGFTGMLYDWERPKALDFSNVDGICENVRKASEVGYEKWQQSHDDLVKFILLDNQEAYINRYDYFTDVRAGAPKSLKNILLRFLRIIYHKFKGV